MNSINRHVYLAGPEVFLANAREIGARKKELCENFGLVGHFPLDDDDPTAPPPSWNEIYDSCVTMMNGCGLAVCNMTPFRGVSMDVGTAIEMGYMRGIGRLVFGYSNVDGDYHSRVTSSGSTDELIVEDYGLADNLMCIGVLRDSGGEIATHSAPTNKILTDLTAFESCLRRVVDIIGVE